MMPANMALNPNARDLQPFHYTVGDYAMKLLGLPGSLVCQVLPRNACGEFGGGGAALIISAATWLVLGYFLLKRKS